MNFLSHPDAYQSAFREACVELGSLAAPSGSDIEVYEVGGYEPLGVKRVYTEDSASINISPYARRLLSPVPLCGSVSSVPTGFKTDPGRTACLLVAAREHVSEIIYLTGGTDDPVLNTVLSDYGSDVKSIRPGERDEISIITGGHTVKALISFEYEGKEYTWDSFTEWPVVVMTTFLVDADQAGDFFRS